MNDTSLQRPTRTRAAVLYNAGARLVIEDEVEIPALRRGQVLVRVLCSGVCRSQLMEVRGKRGEDLYLPHMLGHEGVGLVLAVGPDVTKVSVGTKTVLTWIRSTGIDAGGSLFTKASTSINAGPVTTFTEHAVVSENRCVPLPAGVPDDVGSLFGCALLTGAGMVFNTIQPAREDRVAVWGLGGVGLSALAAFRVCGCRQIIAVDVETSKLELARAFGATDVVDAAHGDPVADVRSLAGGDGVDHAVEAAGRAATIEQAFLGVRKGGGRCVFASHPEAGETIRLDPHELISGRKIEGSWGGDSKPDDDIARLAELYREQGLPLDRMITHRFCLEEINDALDLLEHGGAGRALIEMAGPREAA